MSHEESPTRTLGNPSDLCAKCFVPRSEHGTEDFEEPRHSDLADLVKDYPPNTALARLKLSDGIMDWSIQCHATDDDQSVQKLVGKWMPFADVLGIAFNRKKINP